MLVRIVKMHFKLQETDRFQALFKENKSHIRNFKGCQFLELYRDQNNPELFFTYSYWENEAALENYRCSELFKNIWTETKKMFGGKPEAWSLDKVACASLDKD